ncbi:hypothetical protein ANN_14448 [Periplaneta americana]|uniref:Uncharacterized protein n=1 Tax=Periplaneta americana TaxID=6978 RepID=A0ABQ8SWY9_PERAM|nr:hypothetical protein ANN_14448 [Periplaneta americana]
MCYNFNRTVEKKLVGKLKFLTLREGHRLRVFENKVLRKIFGAKRDENTGEWRKLHNTELHALYSSPDIIRNIKSRRLRWAGHVAHMGESRNAYGVLVGRPEGKRPSGRPRRRWEDNIKIDLREVGYDDREWINLAQDRHQWRAYVRAAMNLRYNQESDTWSVNVFSGLYRAANVGNPDDLRFLDRNQMASWFLKFPVRIPLRALLFVNFIPQIHLMTVIITENASNIKSEEIQDMKKSFDWDEGDNASEINPGFSAESYPAIALNGKTTGETLTRTVLFWNSSPQQLANGTETSRRGDGQHTSNYWRIRIDFHRLRQTSFPPFWKCRMKQIKNRQLVSPCAKLQLRTSRIWGVKVGLSPNRTIITVINTNSPHLWSNG